ncbi:hypothetical protein M3Y99_01323700 [Aphelenchoides fujianensis]|nr:hypothetical protein M3Y99_01323700 [Aphelenchoides fujianensis]
MSRPFVYQICPANSDEKSQPYQPARTSTSCTRFSFRCAAAAGTHRLPLLKQQSSFASKRVPSARHNSKSPSLHGSIRNDPAESDGYDFAVQVQIGTPAQLFYAEVALGSAELWIADSSCQYWSDCDDNCINNCHRFTCEGCCYLPDHCLDSYEHKGELTFGTPFLTLFCAVFDYEKQQIGYAAIN